MVSSTPCQPTKAPTIAIIFTSPPPIASSLRIRCPAKPISQSRPNPVTAPISAGSRVGSPPDQAEQQPDGEPAPA